MTNFVKPWDVFETLKIMRKTTNLNWLAGFLLSTIRPILSSIWGILILTAIARERQRIGRGGSEFGPGDRRTPGPMDKKVSLWVAQNKTLKMYLDKHTYVIYTYIFLNSMCINNISYIIKRKPVVPHEGGGGSFKKRKTIGEIGCCESRMSEQKHWPTD